VFILVSEYLPGSCKPITSIQNHVRKTRLIPDRVRRANVWSCCFALCSCGRQGGDCQSSLRTQILKRIDDNGRKPKHPLTRVDSHGGRYWLNVFTILLANSFSAVFPIKECYILKIDVVKKTIFLRDHRVYRALLTHWTVSNRTHAVSTVVPFYRRSEVQDKL